MFFFVLHGIKFLIQFQFDHFFTKNIRFNKKMCFERLYLGLKKGFYIFRYLYLLYDDLEPRSRA